MRDLKTILLTSLFLFSFWLPKEIYSQEKNYIKATREQEIAKDINSKFGVRLEYEKGVSKKIGVGLTYHYSNNFRFECNKQCNGESSQIGVNLKLYPLKQKNFNFSFGIEKDFQKLIKNPDIEKNQNFNLIFGNDILINKNLKVGWRYERGLDGSEEGNGKIYFTTALTF